MPGNLFKIIRDKISCRVSSLCFADLKNSSITRVNRSDKEALQISQDISTTVEESLIVESEDGEKLCVFLKGGLSWPWSRKVTPVDEATDAIDELGHEYPPPPPSPDDIRHTINYPALKAGYPLAHVGLYHLAMWVPKGQAHSRASVADELRGAVISKRVIATAYKFNAVEKFFRRTTPLMQTIGLLFEAVDKPQYIRYHRNYSDFASKSPLRLFQTTHRACFLGLALLRNLQVEPHKDISDIKDGYVAMVCFGDFCGGEFIVPELGLKLDFKPGDVIFLRSAVLEHFVAPFDGQRSSIVYFTHGNLSDNISDNLLEKGMRLV
ncbi:MAG: hypothetical protein M1840_003835 [Geoglossum simile]|nr:MAG: hypothetical protein M1840_003835 [Geoglossum simile]